MANKLGIGGKSLFQRILGGLVLGIFGFILGTILATIGIFPTLQWANISLLLGVLVGAFYDEVNGVFQ